MLNELYDLSLSLERAGIVPAEWHPDLKQLPTISKAKPCFKVYVSPDGAVSEIEPIDDATKLGGLRKWQSGGNGYSFPCFNVRPLFKAYPGASATNAEKKRFDDLLKAVKKSHMSGNDPASVLKEFAIPANRLWSNEHNKRVTECLNRIPTKLREILGEPPDEFSAIVALIDRCRKTTVEAFFTQIAALLEDRIRKNLAESDKYVGFLLYCGTRPPNNDIQLVLELADGLSAFPTPAMTPKVFAWINQQLLKSRPANLSDATAPIEATDAFGLSNADWEGKLAEVKVPILGGVKLRAMNPESPCQTRYRHIDATSFVVGKEVRRRVKGALEWLTDEEHKNKTWGSVSAVRDDSEILLVYPSELPKAPVAAVAMFGATAMNPAMQSARFVDCAADVTKGLRAIPRSLNEIEMRVFALRKMDKARTQVSCHRRYTAERFDSAAHEWQAICADMPPIQIKQWGKEKGAKPEWRDLDTPFPFEVIWCLNTAWTKEAVEPTRLREFASADGISLLLDEDVKLKPLLERALHSAIRNGGNLLIATAHAQHQNEIHKVSGKYEKQKLLLPAIMALLLAKLGWRKEGYMKSAPYLIGRMLSLADQIHYHYCQHVRNKQAPTRLIGNALMATALEEPEKALALYAQRILPYQAWARTVSGEAAGLARYFLSELGEACSDVALADVPRRCADADKSKMLLGYLAKTEKANSTNTAE